MPASDEDDPLADLADLILNVGRLVRARTPAGTEAVPLNETERQVMRVVDLHPGAAPSEIARRSRLQRTNVSTTLRSLEAKGMIERNATTGRGISVRPTARAADNLRLLRAAWSRELAAVLDEEREAVARTVTLLARLEERFTSDRSP